MAASVVAVFSVVPLRAETTAETALSSGSARLGLYTLLRDRPPGGEEIVHLLMTREGFLPSPGWTTFTSATPVLYWDDNINGGMRADHVVIGGGIWEVDPDSRAKSGIVAGGRLASEQSRQLGFGNKLALSQSLTLAWAPSHDIGIGDLRLSMCSLNYLGEWTFADACIGQRYLRRDDDKSWETWIQGSLSKIMTLGDTPSELGIGLRHAFRDDYEQTTGTVSGLFALKNIGEVGMAWSLGTLAEGHAVVRQSARVSLTRPILGKDTRISLEWLTEEGGQYLGTPRSDEVWIFGVSRALSRKVNIGAGIRTRSSNADPYDSTEMFLNFSFRSFSLN